MSIAVQTAQPLSQMALTRRIIELVEKTAQAPIGSSGYQPPV
jgi:hypothetical protein